MSEGSSFHGSHLAPQKDRVTFPLYTALARGLSYLTKGLRVLHVRVVRYLSLGMLPWPIYESASHPVLFEDAVSSARSVRYRIMMDCVRGGEYDVEEHSIALGPLRYVQPRTRRSF